MLVVVVHAKNEARTFEYDQPVITIGRAEVNDIVLPTPKVSKRHARLEVTAHGLVISDLKSSNGTYINGRRVGMPTVIGEGDRIHVGEFVIELKSAVGLPSDGSMRGFTPMADASAETEQEGAANQPGSTDSGRRRGAAYRMSWLDAWTTSGEKPTPQAGRGSLIESHHRESSQAFTIQASAPALILVGQHVRLRVWADARNSGREMGAGRQRLSSV